MIGNFIAKITGREIKRNKNASTPSRLLQSQVTGKDDIQTVEQLRQAGIDSGPVDDSVAYVIPLSKAWKVAVGVNDLIAPEATPGQLILYSQEGGSKMTQIKLNPDGSLVIDSAAGAEINAAAGLTINAAVGGVDITGDLSVTGEVSATGDIVADLSILGISLIDHYHQGNLGYPTGTSIMTGGGSVPSTPPSTNASGDLIDGSGVNMSSHYHTQPNDSNGDTEQPTSGPI